MAHLSLPIVVSILALLSSSALAINFPWSKSEAEQQTEKALKENPGFRAIHNNHKESGTGSNLLYNPKLEDEVTDVYKLQQTILGSPGPAGEVTLWNEFWAKTKTLASKHGMDGDEDTKKSYYEAAKYVSHIISSNSTMAFAKMVVDIPNEQYTAFVNISPPLSELALQNALLFNATEALFLLNSCRRFFNRQPVAINSDLTTEAQGILTSKIIGGNLIKTFPYVRLDIGFQSKCSVWIYKLPKDIDASTIWFTYPIITMYQMLFKNYQDSKTMYDDGSMWASNTGTQFYCQIRRDIYILMNTRTSHIGIAHEIFTHDGNKYAAMVITFDKFWTEPTRVNSADLPDPVFSVDLESPQFKDKVLTLEAVLGSDTENLDLCSKLITELPKLPAFDFKKNMIIFDPDRLDGYDLHKYSPAK